MRVASVLPEDADVRPSASRDPVSVLQHALDADDLVLFCQPIRALFGAEQYPIAEVLVRLAEEERVLAPPGDFLAVFEHYGMLPQLDRWVVRHAVKYLAAGSGIRRLSINLSSPTLEDVQFVSFVADELKSCDISPEALIFEIDKQDVLARLPTVKRLVSEYRSVGGQVLVDGFAVDAMSFAQLSEVHPAFVKVDGRVTRSLMSTEAAQRKMTALVRAALQFSFEIVAECVEDQAVLLRLKHYGVSYAQGLGIHLPVPLASFPASVGTAAA